MPIRYLFPYVGLCLVLSFGVAAPVRAEKAFPKLHNAVNAYYKAEKSGNWKAVYLLRTDSFREDVRERDFVDAMKKYDMGWYLDKATIISTQVSGNRAVVKLRFRVRPPARFWRMMRVRPKEFLELTDSTIWRMNNGAWRCQRSSSIGHLPFTE